ncbi:hypothetical protein [Streptomyces sp. AM 2-1-1]|uniref:hypothetical protein n=1 Tax=unclassified Streptomyces TaxID=2593676 RepID=UPI0023B91B85|nr:hypothetical protein [Streptomyces sp. AM 2-1-1]WEH43210.1 hypothetical protein PZB77_28970 [Streptomyces sp. AM 2-1-1]
MGGGFEGPDGRAAAWEVEPGPPGDPLRLGLRITAPDRRLDLLCTPAAARELAARLVAAAESVEGAAPAAPVTVRADELLRGDVRDGPRVMTVESVRAEGATVQVGWTSGAGRSWTQVYDAGTPITLRRRLRADG